MPIHKPEKVLLHHIPLKFVQDKVSGGGKKSVDQSLPLVPFIDFLITIVVFLIMQCGSSSSISSENITMPSARNAAQVELAPIVAVSPRQITLDGRDLQTATDEIARAQEIQPIQPLVRGLEILKRNYGMIHPGEDFPGQIILQADESVDFKVIKHVMFSAAAAGYTNISFLVNDVGGGGGGGGEGE